MSRTPGKRSNSRITEIWRSLLSWMHWHRRARQRQEEWRRAELDELKERLLFQLLLVLPTQAQVEEIVHRQLMLAMAPLAQALIRQDNLLIQVQDQINDSLWEQREQQEDLLKEVLNSLQPPVEQQLLTYRPQPPTSPS